MAISPRDDTALAQSARQVESPDVDNASCCIPYLAHTERKTGTDEAKKPDADAVLTCLYVK
ncbi:hypothetical protein BBJ22_23740 [Escherichia coli]|nr:hypothetical protein [Escherichia coli]PBU02451.1 hypothetical protein BBJ22_23740 [Escherichia coli]PBU09899.1 hypothetical protein BBJ24_23660 [Escherichia coli]